MNSSDQAYQRDMFLLDFIDSKCPDADCSLSDYDEALEEYQILLSDAIARGNKTEIKDLRRDIQRCRVEKRNYKRMINNERGIVLT